VLFAVAAVAAIAVAPAWTAEDEPPVFALVDTLIQTPPADHATVERLTGASLELDYSGYLDDYSAEDVKTGGAVTIKSILYREPVPGRGSLAGPLLLLEPGGACVTLAAVMARYPGLSAAGDAVAHSDSEQTYYSRAEDWGKLAFGFPGRAGRCLKSVSFTLHPKPPPQE